MMRSPVKPFQLLAGHPALDLVNTLNMRFSEEARDLLPTYAELLRLAAQLRLLSAEHARKLARTVRDQDAARVLAGAVELRETLAAVLYARVDQRQPRAADVHTLQTHFHSAAVHRHLRAGEASFVWNWADAARQPELPLWMLAQSAADLLVSSDAERVKDCGDPGCRWLFLDVSKNHTRRWCDMKTCGNRMKARRHQARLQTSPL